ncbi:hypothetical protein JS531_06245 [Bifidobacterium sp. CP2]|uniref:hypothetical protein n=1 Tax=Bifidobacterium sp. CP2 TaxID=2809025 RepID=UPI001BDD36F8|nr:hypothetical protein [Bifidobacterium sp. CP2]MBT1181568.1 hypothetical protein [Bifidobacterium sp. CP2]
MSDMQRNDPASLQDIVDTQILEQTATASGARAEAETQAMAPVTAPAVRPDAATETMDPVAAPVASETTADVPHETTPDTVGETQSGPATPFAPAGPAADPMTQPVANLAAGFQPPATFPAPVAPPVWTAQGVQPAPVLAAPIASAPAPVAPAAPLPPQGPARPAAPGYALPTPDPAPEPEPQRPTGPSVPTILLGGVGILLGGFGILFGLRFSQLPAIFTSIDPQMTIAVSCAVIGVLLIVIGIGWSIGSAVSKRRRIKATEPDAEGMTEPDAGTPEDGPETHDGSPE